jgi:hypothetical protein
VDCLANFSQVCRAKVPRSEAIFSCVLPPSSATTFHRSWGRAALPPPHRQLPARAGAAHREWAAGAPQRRLTGGTCRGLVTPCGGRRTGVLESSDPNKANRRSYGSLIKNPALLSWFYFVRENIVFSAFRAPVTKVSGARFAYKDGEVFHLWTRAWWIFHSPLHEFTGFRWVKSWKVLIN